LFLIDAKTGKDIWTKEKDADLTVEQNMPAILHYGSKMLLLYDNDMIGFVDVKNGKELWTKKTEIADIKGYLTVKNAGGGYLRSVVVSTRGPR